MSAFGSIRKLPSGRYQARYHHKGVSYKAPSMFKTKRLAGAWLSGEEELITFGQWTPPAQREAAQEKRKASRITVGEWVERFHEALRHRPVPVKESTIQVYERSVRNRITAPLPPGDKVAAITRLAGIALADLTKNDVYEWWEAISVVYKSPTVNQKAYKRLKAACAAAVDRELIPANPVEIKAAGIRVKPEEKYLPSDEELKAIIEHMPARYKALTSLVLFHGLRIGEALALEQRHVRVIGDVPYAPRILVTIEQNAQRLTEKVDGKSHVYMNWQTPKTSAGYRTVPIMASHTRFFFDHMRDYPAVACRVRSQWGDRMVKLFTTTRTGRLVMDTSYRSRLNAAEVAAGVTTDIDPHCGRNWLITRLAEQGAHVKEIGKLLGQSDLETIIRVYMKVRTGRIDVLMDKVNLSISSE